MLQNFLTNVLPWIVLTNATLSLISKGLELAHQAVPDWLKTVTGSLQKLIDWLSANPAHKQLPPDQPPQQ